MSTFKHSFSNTLMRFNKFEHRFNAHGFHWRLNVLEFSKSVARESLFDFFTSLPCSNITWWRHGNIFRVTGPLCGEFTGHRWIPLTKASDAELWCFLWSAPWINGWVNNREAGDLRHHRSHFDVTVMIHTCFPFCHAVNTLSNFLLRSIL